jgi:hypothetical protein
MINIHKEADNIVDSFRFYIMLGMVMADKSPYLKDKSIDEYKKFLREQNIPDKNIEFYIHKACTTLPTEFNQIMQMEGVYFKERQTFFMQDKELKKKTKKEKINNASDEN